MLTNAKLKIIKSLQQKKFREKYKLFVVEGQKIVSDYIKNTNLVQEIFISNQEILSKEIYDLIFKKKIEVSIVDEIMLRRVSNMVTSPNCIAIVRIETGILDFKKMQTEKTIVLDSIQDPGNLGTIIRTADWFGISNIVCSNETADCFSPKVIQASMGSICNVSIIYHDLEFLLKNASDSKIEIYGTLLNGSDVNSVQFNKYGMLLLGNESKGISANLIKFISKPITISKAESAFAESLNVAIANAICCSRWYI